MRMFVALTPSLEALEDLDAFLEPRREAGAELRWTPADQWHVTLAFLPDVADRHLDDLVERLGRAARRRDQIALSVGGGGAFPDVAHGRVLFAALAPEADSADEELRRLATGARAAATKAGTVVEGARFHPHLTLARSGRPRELTRWVRLLDAYRGPAWTASEIVLVASHLGEGPRRRPRHEVVAELPLGP